MHVPLWEGDDDAGLIELAIDRLVQLGHGWDAVIDSVYENAQTQHEGIIAKAGESHRRRRGAAAINVRARARRTSLMS